MSIKSLKACADIEFGATKSDLIKPNITKPSKKTLKVKNPLLLNYIIPIILDNVIFILLSDIVFILLFGLLNLVKSTDFSITDLGAR